LRPHVERRYALSLGQVVISVNFKSREALEQPRRSWRTGFDRNFVRL